MSISINIRSFRINIIITSKQILSLVGRSIGSIPSEMPFKDNIDISAQLQHTTLRHQYQYHQINNLSNLVNTTLPYRMDLKTLFTNFSMFCAIYNLFALCTEYNLTIDQHKYPNEDDTDHPDG